MPSSSGQRPVALAAALVVSIMVNAVQAAAPDPMPPLGPPGPTPGPSAPRVPASNSATATVNCEFHQLGDVGMAAGPGRTVSGRGWWDQGNCPVVRAAVRVRLQARHSGNWWDIVSAATVTVPPGTRAEAKFRCDGVSWTKWRSVVDVDLFQRPDDGEDLVTRPQIVACRPDVAALHR